MNDHCGLIPINLTTTCKSSVEIKAELLVQNDISKIGSEGIVAKPPPSTLKVKAN